MRQDGGIWPEALRFSAVAEYGRHLVPGMDKVLGGIVLRFSAVAEYGRHVALARGDPAVQVVAILGRR